ncbi:MAG: M20 family metallopeptidase [Candidatus Zipacnadales bacterium]
MTSQLVKIESVNAGPAGSPVGGSPEANISRFVQQWLEEHGIKAVRHAFLPGRFNVSACVPGSGSGRLLFDAHTDTVPVEGMLGDPFSGEIRDGCVYGRGACDDKGSLAAAMCALAGLVADGVQPPFTVELLASGDEEGGFRGIRHWVAQGGQADAAIVGEASELALIGASKGALRLKVRTRGRAAHTAVPEAGVNAIIHMAHLINSIEKRLKPVLEARCHPLLGSPKVSVSMIAGGRRANIIPDWCELHIDRRLLPSETRESVLAEFDALFAELEGEDATIHIERTEPYSFVPAAECPLDHPLVQTVAAALEAENLATGVCGVPYTTHASVLAEVGIPCITLGPGNIEQAHSPDEWVSINQLERAVRIYRHIFETFGGNHG